MFVVTHGTLPSPQGVIHLPTHVCTPPPSMLGPPLSKAVTTLISMLTLAAHVSSRNARFTLLWTLGTLVGIGVNSDKVRLTSWIPERIFSIPFVLRCHLALPALKKRRAFRSDISPASKRWGAIPLNPAQYLQLPLTASPPRPVLPSRHRNFLQVPSRGLEDRETTLPLPLSPPPFPRDRLSKIVTTQDSIRQLTFLKPTLRLLSLAPTLAPRLRTMSAWIVTPKKGQGTGGTDPGALDAHAAASRAHRVDRQCPPGMPWV
ncbi:hypothetical protein GGX14DRAFT_566529 [Mycena pura]|uniref:Uncharacterized protein n=1 Tax=Mycena pura TaxID=153505 RepID=A0AAD6VG12_9AGAR|nr:hypothetical protein GGX14DRAFT_566529 [Mycena pura]